MEVEGALELNRILFDHSKDAYDLSCQMVDAVEVRMLVSFFSNTHKIRQTYSEFGIERESRVDRKEEKCSYRKER